MRGLVLLCALLWGAQGAAQVIYAESPRSSRLWLKLGGYKPMIGSEAGLTGNPYDRFFGSAGMTRFDLAFDRFVWQGFGALGVGVSLGYAEKVGATFVTEPADGGEPQDTRGSEKSGLHVLPLSLVAMYQLDYGARQWGIPLVPHLKAGLAYIPWWTSKGDGVEVVGGQRAAGGKWGYTGVAGLSLVLDGLEPRMARNLDSEFGINHAHLFAEYHYTQAPGFGGGGLNLSARHWMFGLSFEF
jgi:hypothetical protein